MIRRHRTETPSTGCRQCIPPRKGTSQMPPAVPLALPPAAGAAPALKARNLLQAAPLAETRSGTEAHPRHAEAESHAGNGRALAPASQTWVYPLSGKSVPGHAQAEDVPAAEGQSNLQGKAIRTDAVSRPACSGRCEGGAAEMPDKP